MRHLALRTGDWVEVRSKTEILATLDARGELDAMPFMPEMLQFCGQRFRVWKRAHKTCDTVNRTGGRRVRDAVHLQELRCEGSAHGGCEAACLLFWKERWLKRVDGPHPARNEGGGVNVASRAPAGACTEQQLAAATRVDDRKEGSKPIYSCQATLLPRFTTPLPWWDFRQYVEDYTSGNVTLWQLICGAVYVMYYGLITRAQRVSPALAWRLLRLYDLARRPFGGTPYPRLRGSIPAGNPTPARRLDLQPGEIVRVLPYEQVLATLDTRNKNRGMFFDAEEVPFCGKTFRVRSTVSQIIDERTGEMIPIKGGNVLLEGSWCQARYSDRRMMCPRAIYPIWRETWLERVNDGGR